MVKSSGASVSALHVYPLEIARNQKKVILVLFLSVFGSDRSSSPTENEKENDPISPRQEPNAYFVGAAGCLKMGEVSSGNFGDAGVVAAGAGGNFGRTTV